MRNIMRVGGSRRVAVSSITRRGQRSEMRAGDRKHQELADEFLANVGRIMRGMRLNFRRQMERYEVT